MNGKRKQRNRSGYVDIYVAANPLNDILGRQRRDLVIDRSQEVSKFFNEGFHSFSSCQ